MKKVTVQVALLSLSPSFAAMAIGLGDLTVHSALNQPFDAEIALFDLGGTPLSMIRANLAPASEFERLGIEMSNMVSTLRFSVERNKTGQAVIRIRSDARMKDPFMQILVDLAWAKGQTYRAYSLFLDPPNYQIVLDKGRPSIKPRPSRRHHTDTEHYVETSIARSSHDSAASTPEQHQSLQEASYGPTLADETIWQIAERYRKEGLNLQQVVLGIVGMNPDAFTDANLNGLKTGVRLRLPSTRQLMTVAADKAKLEVLAHDSAWENKQSIQHVIEPPYIQAIGSKPSETALPFELPSILPKAPTFAAILSSTAASSHYMPVPNVFMLQNQDKALFNTAAVSASATVDTKLRAEMNLATAAIESIREANALLSEQFHELQARNTDLLKKLKQRDQDMAKMRAEIRRLTERQGLAAQTSAQNVSNTSNTIPWLFILAALLAGAGIVYRQYKWQQSAKTNHVEDSGIDRQTSTAIQVPHDLPRHPAAEVQIDIIEPVQIEAGKTATDSELPLDASQQNIADVQETINVSEMNVSLAEVNKPIEDKKAVKEKEEDDLASERVEKASSIELIEYVPSPLPQKTEDITAAAIQKSDEQMIEYIVSEETLSGDQSLRKTTSEESDGGLCDELDDNTIEFNTTSAQDSDEQDVATVEIIPVSTGTETNKKKRPKPVKSKQAIETLMALAKTYIVMGDMIAARESLLEIVRDAKGSLQAEAKSLLDELDKDHQ